MKTAKRTRLKLIAAIVGGMVAAACLAQAAARLQEGAARRRVVRTATPADAPADVKSPAGRAPDGGSRASLAAVGPPSFDPATDLVVFPDERVELIVGPQLKAGSARNPYPWFDRVQLSKGREVGEQFPSTPPLKLSGTVGVQSGARTVAGVGTSFRREVDPNGPAPMFNGRLRIQLPDKSYRDVKVAAVVSDTQLTLSAPWAHASVSGASADTFYRDASSEGWNYDRYYDSAYYDLALVQYVNYYRTGDPAFLAYARKAADSWWGSQWVGHGTVTSGPDNLPPRSMAYAGMMLRALDGRPEMWDYLHRQTRAAFDNWVGLRLRDPSLYYDIREDGYAQLYAVLMARALPDSYALYGNGTLSPPTGAASDGARKRASLLSDAGRAAVEFFGRLQRPDGSWRWDIPGMGLVNVEQPFMLGLYLESVVALDRLTRDAAVKASLRAQLEKACRHLYTQTYRGREAVADMPRYRWRGLWYFWGGGTRQNPTLYERGEGERAAKGDVGMIRQVRHLNATIHHAFGYAYAVTGDEEYLRMGEEIFDASYGERGDGIRGQADSARAKDYAMNFRASGRYLAWRLSGTQRHAAAAAPQVDARPAGVEPSELLAAAFSLAQALSQSSSRSEEQVKELSDNIEGARRAFASSAGAYVSTEGVLSELDGALKNVRAALAMLKAGDVSDDSARLRLEWAAARLKRAKDRVRRR